MPSREKLLNKKPRSGKCQDLEDTSGRTRQGHKGAEGPAPGKPLKGRQEPGCRLREAKGGAYRHENNGRRRHTARGAGKCVGGWQVTGGQQRSGERHFKPGEEVGSG